MDRVCLFWKDSHRWVSCCVSPRLLALQIFRESRSHFFPRDGGLDIPIPRCAGEMGSRVEEIETIVIPRCRLVPRRDVLDTALHAEYYGVLGSES